MPDRLFAIFSGLFLAAVSAAFYSNGLTTLAVISGVLAILLAGAALLLPALFAANPGKAAVVSKSFCRQFGSILAVLAAIIGIAGFRSQDLDFVTFMMSPGPAAGLLILVPVFILLAMLRPMALQRPSRLWLRFGMALGLVTGPVFLTVLYLAVFTIFGLVLMMFGRRPLKAKDDDGSFWKRQSEEVDFSRPW